MPKFVVRATATVYLTDQELAQFEHDSEEYWDFVAEQGDNSFMDGHFTHEEMWEAFTE